ncbi:MAG: carbohydrate porin [Acetobacteraceae bacterium]
MLRWMVLGLLLWSSGAAAQAEPETTGLWTRENLLGDIGGLRPALKRFGASLGLQETSEVLGNPTGGRARGVVYEGATELSLGVDLKKLGGIFNISAFQIHGRGLSINDIDNLNLVSSIEADRSTRLFELWYQQALFGDKADIRVGQLAADTEFTLSKYAEVFINSGFGWPTVGAIDLPAGGPAYPLATPGVRLRARPDERTTLLLGVFNGDPAGPGEGDPQLRNQHGVNLRFRGTLVLAEAQFATNQGKAAAGLPATYKIGGWYDSVGGIDPIFSVGGDVAALPTSLSHRPDWGVYLVIDQSLHRTPGTDDGGLGVFLRAAVAPPDRNQLVASVIAGVSWTGVAGRADDVIGLGVGWARVGGVAINADRAMAATQGGHFPVRGTETVIELTYQAHIAKWWQVQPDFQYVVNPSGGILNPDGSGKTVGSAAIFGIRTVVTF